MNLGKTNFAHLKEIKMAPMGFEPTTPGFLFNPIKEGLMEPLFLSLKVQCSARLSYGALVSLGLLATTLSKRGQQS